MKLAPLNLGDGSFTSLIPNSYRACIIFVINAKKVKLKLIISNTYQIDPQEYAASK
jgi:hypothetical protein